MLQILIVDDEENLRKAVAKYAKFQGYSVEEASNGEEAVQLCRSKRFDLILLDLMMPGMDGIAACRAIRKFSDTPIIMLTAKNEEYDRIIGFESGADDYVAKPFSPKELMLRINAVLKRTRRAKERAPVCIGRMQFSAAGQWLEVDGVRSDLTSKETELLDYLMSRPGEIISREELCSAVWGGTIPGSSRTVDTHIKQLRKAMQSCSGYITTNYGRGYRFEVD